VALVVGLGSWYALTYAPVCTAQQSSSTSQNQTSREEQGEKAIQITQGPSVTDVSSSSATIKWSTNGNAANQIQYSKQGSNDWKSAYTAGGSRDHSMTLGGREPGQSYDYRIMTREQEVRTRGQFQTSGARGTSTGAGASGSMVPLYRSVNSANDHLLTTSQSEASASGYRMEGQAGYLSSTPSQGAVPLYRLTSNDSKVHLYTTDSGERDRSVRDGYKDEGVAGFIATSQLPGTTPFYRLFNSANRDHLYTTSPEERQKAMQSGYKDEGIVGYIWNSK